MKKHIYILLASTLFTMSSCSKSDLDFSNDISPNFIAECLPFIEIDLSVENDFLFPSDPSTSIVAHRQEGNCLILDTRFGGGCEEHVLQLLIDVNGQSSINASTTFQSKLSHNNTDLCEALVALEVYIDISMLETLEFDMIMLSIEDYEELVELTF